MRVHQALGLSFVLGALFVAGCRGESTQVHKRSSGVAAGDHQDAIVRPTPSEQNSPTPGGQNSPTPSVDAVAPPRVGLAEVDVSPAKNVVMGGYGTYVFPLQKPRTSSGIHDPIMASAVAISDKSGGTLILVTLDVIGLSSASVQRMRNAILSSLGGVKGVSVLISATHSHQGPDTLGLWGALPLTGRDSEYQAFLERSVVSVAARAFSSLGAAKIYLSSGNLENSTTAASDETKRDDRFLSLDFRGANDITFGTLTQWAAHPTILEANNNTISSDFAGAFRFFMKSQVAGSHFYVNGAVGNVYPLPPSGELVADPFAGVGDPDVGDGYRKVATVGKRLAESVQAVLPKSVELPVDTIDVCTVGFTMPISNLKFIAATTSGVVETKFDGGGVATEVSVVRLGTLKFVAVPGEALPSVGAAIRALFSSEGGTVGILGLTNDWLGYLMTEQEFASADFKYWADLSPHQTSGTVIVDAVARAMRRDGCK